MRSRSVCRSRRCRCRRVSVWTLPAARRAAPSPKTPGVGAQRGLGGGRDGDGHVSRCGGAGPGPLSLPGPEVEALRRRVRDLELENARLRKSSAAGVPLRAGGCLWRYGHTVLSASVIFLCFRMHAFLLPPPVSVSPPFVQHHILCRGKPEGQGGSGRSRIGSNGGN